MKRLIFSLALFVMGSCLNRWNAQGTGIPEMKKAQFYPSKGICGQLEAGKVKAEDLVKK